MAGLPARAAAGIPWPVRRPDLAAAADRAAAPSDEARGDQGRFAGACVAPHRGDRTDPRRREHRNRAGTPRRATPHRRSRSGCTSTPPMPPIRLQPITSRPC